MAWIGCFSSQPNMLGLLGVWLAAIAQEGAVHAADKSPPPQRIVAVAPSTAEIVCDLRACQSIVGVSKFCIHPPELKSRTQVGGLYDPDLEAIASLHPDLLIMRGHHDGLERLAERLKIRVYHDETDSLDGIRRTVRELGSLLGQEEQAQSIVHDFDMRLSRLQAQHADKNRVRVLLTVSRNPERLANILTAGRGSFLTEMLEAAGGVNVFGDLDMRYPEVSVESIIAAQPDVILELMPEVDVAANEKRLREQWKTVPGVGAVQNGRIYLLDDPNALIPSPRYIEFIEKVSRILHSTGTTK